jgi:hypothetical protein
MCNWFHTWFEDWIGQIGRLPSPRRAAMQHLIRKKPAGKGRLGKIVRAMVVEPIVAYGSVS